MRHDECRRRVCAICYDEKGRKAEAGRTMSKKQEEGIKKFVNPGYNMDDPRWVKNNIFLFLTPTFQSSSRDLHILQNQAVTAPEGGTDP